MTDVVDLARELVALNTVNPDLEPGAPGERPAVKHLATRLECSGFEIEIIGPRERPSLLATPRGPAADAPALALNGHLDTVSAGGMRDPFTPRIDGDRLYGRGTCDMKAGIAALVVAAEHAARVGTDGDVLLALVADEEHGSPAPPGVIADLERSGRLPAACIVAEPTWLDLATAHRGFAVIEVELRGRAAHSSRPQDGVSAATRPGRPRAAAEARNAALAPAPPHPDAGHGSLQATVAPGGTAPFVLPDRA